MLIMYQVLVLYKMVMELYFFKTQKQKYSLRYILCLLDLVSPILGLLNTYIFSILLLSTEEKTMNLQEMSREQLEALVQQQAVAAKKKTVVKVSQKGCVQINGIRRFPVTFYKNEWKQIFAMKDEIEQFIVDNDHLLATK